ncbi:YlxM family DNA-binding protein [Companilactobacillus jidongensis]|uniref:YlxM family DNA-binding protein n=1 Tax=Companilactobacillus jidongensis TaxID=2486006 RepID=UPI000F79C04E|nr:YlxM family DNA-binding protein [Companilactobacillus jidongensis]
MDINETTKINLLYNFYHSLLTKKQSQYINLYYVEDFSLSEIAEQLDVSRQAVMDNLHRSVSLLESFEKELGLVQKTQEIDDIASLLDRIVLTKYPKDKELVELVRRISKINEK